MGLTDKPTDTRTPAQRIADQVLRSIPSQADMIERTYNLNYNRIWNTPGVDPEDVLAALGTNAAAIFMLTNQIMGLARPESLKAIPNNYTYAINTDGSITLTPVDRSSSSSDSSASSSSRSSHSSSSSSSPTDPETPSSDSSTSSVVA